MVSIVMSKFPDFFADRGFVSIAFYAVIWQSSPLTNPSLQTMTIRKRGRYERVTYSSCTQA